MFKFSCICCFCLSTHPVIYTLYRNITWYIVLKFTPGDAQNASSGIFIWHKYSINWFFFFFNLLSSPIVHADMSFISCYSLCLPYLCMHINTFNLWNLCHGLSVNVSTQLTLSTDNKLNGSIYSTEGSYHCLYTPSILFW